MKLQIPLDSNLEFAAALGRLLGHWAIAEMQVVSILQILLGINEPRAQIVFMTFISLKSKLDLTMRLTHNFVETCPAKDGLISLLMRAARLNTERNGFIHATWAAGRTANSLTRFPNTLIRDTKLAFRAVDDLTPQDVQTVVDKISSLSAELQHFLLFDAPKLVIRQVPPSWLPNPVA